MHQAKGFCAFETSCGSRTEPVPPTHPSALGDCARLNPSEVGAASEVAFRRKEDLGEVQKGQVTSQRWAKSRVGVTEWLVPM